MTLVAQTAKWVSVAAIRKGIAESKTAAATAIDGQIHRREDDSE
jgi:hypothetical protein